MCCCQSMQVILIEPTGGNYIPWGANISPTLVRYPPSFIVAVNAKSVSAWRMVSVMSREMYAAALQACLPPRMSAISAWHISAHALTSKHNVHLSCAALADLHSACIGVDRHERPAMRFYDLDVGRGPCSCEPVLCRCAFSILLALHTMGQSCMRLASQVTPIGAQQ